MRSRSRENKSSFGARKVVRQASLRKRGETQDNLEERPFDIPRGRSKGLSSQGILALDSESNLKV